MEIVIKTEDAVNFLQEFFNLFNPKQLSSIKSHRPKIGIPILLLLNLNPLYLYNVIRLMVTEKCICIEAVIFTETSSHRATRKLVLNHHYFYDLF